MSNIDTALATLAQEINDLDKQSKGARYEMGRRLVAVREILCEHFGKSPVGSGCPVGWAKWVRDNLNMAQSSASRCIQIYHDPDGQRAKKIIHNQKYAAQTAIGLITRTRKIWPKITPDERSEFRRLVIELSKEAY